METIFTYILKVNALLVLFYLVYQLALSKETFYKQSRWFLLSGLFVSLILPFVTFTKIEYIEVKQVIEESLGVVKISKEVIQEPLLTYQEIVFLIYGIICFGFLIKTVFDFIKLFKIINVSNSEKRNKLVYVNTNLVHTPFSFFNYIIFNSDVIHPTELENIIKHEEAHSNQKHSLDTLAAQFFIILFWFNPIVWLYRKSMVQNLEFLADNLAIQHVSDKVYYQRTMLKVSTQASNISIVNTFNQSSIKKRIIMLNSNQSNRKNAFKYAIVIPVLVAFIMLFQVKVIAKEKRIDREINNSENILYLINANSSNKEIDEIINKLKGIHQLEAKYYGVKRNKNNEIIAITLKIKDQQIRTTVHEINGDSAIKEFAIQINTKSNVFEIIRSEEIGYGTDATKNKNADSNISVETEVVSTEIEESESSENEEVTQTLEVQPIISESETQPEPQNGMQEFRKQIAMKFRLPEVENDVNVTIVAKFLVSKTGQILNITIPKEEPKNLGLGEELKRILKESPNWKPGTIDGKPVDVNFALPISIKITASK
jgi:Zn-dependent protease with chaperone function